MTKQDISLRSQVQILSKQGYSNSRISEILNVSLKFVKTWKKRQNFTRKSGSGRKSKLTSEVLRKIKLSLTSKKNNSTRKTAKKICLSQSTIVNARKKLKLKAYHVGKTTVMSEEIKKKRLEFAIKNKNRKWSTILFCDETSIELQPCINSKNNIQYATSRNQVKPFQTFKHPMKVHVSAGISWYGKTDVHIFTDNLNADLYVQILQNTIIPCANDIFGDLKWTLLQDNDPKHKSKKVVDFLQSQNIDFIKSNEWPSYSPDLNAIENIWSILKQNIAKRNPKTKASLIKFIKEEWCKIDDEIIKRTINTMKNRMELVIKENGGKTKY